MAAPRKPPRKKTSSRLGEGDLARAMRLRIYPARGQEGRLGQWLYCAKRFRNEAVAFCSARRKARGTWLWQHPALARDWTPEEFQGADADACSKWLTSRLEAAREAVRLHLGIQCGKGELTARVSEAFAQLSRGEKDEIEDGWLLAVPRTVLDQVLQNLAKTDARAISDRKKAKEAGGTKKRASSLAGFPRFRKWQYPGSVRLQVTATKNARFREHWQAGELFIPGLGRLKFRDGGYTLPATPPSMITLTRDAGGCFHVSFFCVEREYRQIKPGQDLSRTRPLPLDQETGLPVARAIDLSLTHLGVDDQGQSLGRKRHLKRFAKALRRKSKSLARKQKGSARWQKARRELGRLHVRIANCREAELRMQTKALVDRSAIVCLEDYRLAFMLQNASLTQSTQDAGLYRFKQLIKAQCDKQGKLLLHCGRFDASTQICSACDYQHTELKNNLSLRSWVCPSCKATHDRDQNAATNILCMALTRATQDFSSGPEKGLGMSTSRQAQLRPDLSTFIARGGLTAILDQTRSRVRRREGLLPHPGQQGADEARVLPMKPINSRRERSLMG